MIKHLYLVWYSENENKINKIALLSHIDNKYIFKYLNFKNNDLQLFTNNGLYPGFKDINKTYISNTLFETILDRLPKKNRSDYNEILSRLHISKDNNDFTILWKSKGKLNSDNYLFISKNEYYKLKKEFN